MRCPSLDETATQVLALLPRGRAWRTHRQSVDPDSVLYKYWRSFAEVLSFFNERVCAVRLEFWCATQSETYDQWMIEYGLPDGCDPYPDLCAKVSAIGGSTCAYYTEAAARIGWTIECGALVEDCGAVMGCALMGNAFTGGIAPKPQLRIRVDLVNSPAFAGKYGAQPVMGCLQMGEALNCEPDITSLICLLERIVQAHVEVVYVVIPPPTYIMVDENTMLGTETGSVLIAQ